MFGEEQAAVGPFAPGYPAGGGLSEAGFPEAASPIVFGPAAATAIDSMPPGAKNFLPKADESAFGAGTTAADLTASTTWPAQAAPALKLGAKAVIADGEHGGFDQWHESRDLVPIERPNGQPSPPARSAPSVERLPLVLTTEAAPPWDEHRRSPAISKAIYPSTGK